jgi:hypothetical protein
LRLSGRQQRAEGKGNQKGARSPGNGIDDHHMLLFG